MKKYLLPTALFIGIFGHILFWEKEPGIAYPIFIIVSLLAGFVLLRSERSHPAPRTYILIAITILFALLTAVRKDYLSTFLNASLSLLCLLILAMTYIKGSWARFNALDYIHRFFHLLGSSFILPWKFIASINKNHNHDDEPNNKRVFGRIMLGLLLSLPILAIFTTLLANADLVFAQRLENLIEHFTVEDLAELLARIFLILFTAYVFISLTLYAYEKSSETDDPSHKAASIPPFLGYIEGTVILSSVVLLFSAFVLIQFQYFFSGQSNITSAGFTYAEYARRGYSELILVACFSFIMLQVLGSILKIKTSGQRKGFIALSVVLLACVLVILLSAFQRLSLYEAAYGFTTLRTYAHVFIIWLGLLLIARIVLEIINRQDAFANLLLFTAIGFTLSLNILNPGSLIVRKNIERTLQGESLDYSYLSTLTSDATPALVHAFSSPEFSQDTHDEIAAALLCRYVPISTRPTPWQSFNLSAYLADRSLARAQTQLDTYGVFEEPDDFVFEIHTPDGNVIPCYPDAAID